MIMNGSSEPENASLFFAKFTVQKTFIKLLQTDSSMSLYLGKPP
jgi:hypothetical protein